MTLTPTDSRGAPSRPGAGAAGPVSGRTVVLDGEPGESLASAIDGAPRWVGGALAGVQAALLSLAVVVVPVLVAYVTASAGPGDDVGWPRSVGIGADLWLLGHGVPLGTGAGMITLVPLGLSVLAVFACYASARRSGYATRSGFLGALGAYTAAVVLVALARLPGGDELGPSAGRALVGAVGTALVLGGIGLGAGLLARPEAPRLTEVLAPVSRRIPRSVRVGVAGGVAVAAAVVGLGGVVVASWVLAGQAQIADIVASLELDAVGGIALAVGELALVPNLVLWAVAWLAGPGFAVGAGSHFATTGVLATPLPAVPLLGALPSGETITTTAAWWPASVVVVGALVGAALHRRLGAAPWTSALAAAGSAAAVAGVVIAVLVSAAGGAAGPGRLEQVGASGLVTGVAVAGLAGIGLATVLLGANVHVRRGAVAAWHRVRRRARSAGAGSA